MCNAGALAGGQFAISTMSALAKHQGAQDDANEERKFNIQTAYNAEVARNLSWNQIGMRQSEESDAATMALTDNQTRAIKARALGDVSAAENGVQGNSVESVARDFYMQQDRIDGATVRNHEMSIQQLQIEKDQEQAKYASRTQFKKIKDPSLLGLGLEIAGGAVGAGSSYESMTGPRGRVKGTA